MSWVTVCLQMAPKPSAGTGALLQRVILALL
jgi:hypothetical protein